MRRSLVAIGVGAFALAVALVASGTAPPWATVLRPLGAAAAVVAGAWVVYRDSDDRLGPLPSVESPVASDPPGARLNVALGSLVGRGRVELTPRGIRDALRCVATAVVAARDGVPRDRARAAIDDGSWIDDGVAARFLASSWSLPADGVRRRLARAVGVGGDRPLVVAARRGANAIAARAGIGDDELDAPDADAAEPAASWFPPGPSEGARQFTVAAPELDGEGSLRERARTGRFHGVAAFALGALGVGVFAGSPAVAFAGVVAVAFAAWGHAASVPAVSLTVEREVDSRAPDAGDRVEVRTRLANAGDSRLPEVRIVDGVPAALSVVDGSAREHCALAPGEAVELSYVVEARRGVHAFGGTLAVVRDSAGTVEERHVIRESGSEVDGGQSAPELSGEDEPEATTIRCVPPLTGTAPGVPLRRQATAYAGNVVTDEGGAGLEFFQTREYRSGDPLSRVDWNRLARTGDLATTEFREERAASVVVVVDGRAAGYVAPDPTGPHALDRAVDAAGTLFDGLLAAGNRVGVAAVSTEDCWLAPSAGAGHRERARELLATNPALSPVPADRNLRVKRSVDRLRRRIPDGAQVLFLTPLCDDRAAHIARRFEAGGRAVTVISPDPTRAESPSRRLARVGRRLRVTGLRQRGLRVVDWTWDEPLTMALARTEARGGSR